MLEVAWKGEENNGNGTRLNHLQMDTMQSESLLYMLI